MNNSGQGSVTLQNSVRAPIQNIKIFGRSVQNGTPTPENPIPIESIGDKGTVKITVSSKNLSPVETLSVEGSQSVSFTETLPAGTYTILADVESTDTDADYCLLLFYYNDSTTKEVNISRGAGQSIVSEFAKPVTRVRFYAGANYNGSVGDTATFSNININTSQSITMNTPDGLPGIPVNSGGNFVDSTGQEWICNYRDWARGVDVKRCNILSLTSQMDWVEYRTVDVIYSGLTVYAMNVDPNILSGKSVGICDWFVYKPWSWAIEEEGIFSFSSGSVYFNVPKDVATTLEEWKAFLQDKSFTVVYSNTQVAPIETPIPADELAAYNALMCYDDTTIVSNDENAHMWVQYLTQNEIDSPWYNAKTEIAQYYKALAGYSTEYPESTCRETKLIHKLLDADYTLDFSVTDRSSRTEKYLWDLINGTSEMLNNIPKSDTEKFLHMLLGGEVTDYPMIDCERNYWMSNCVERQLRTQAMHKGRGAVE